MAHVMVLDSLNEDIFVCGNCKSAYNSLQCYLEHKRLTCNNVIIEDQFPPNDYDSPSPEATLPSEDLATPQQNEEETVKEEHMATNDNQTCKFCFKKFKTLKGLMGHVRFHKGKSYQCLICGRSFIQNSHLQRHIASHKMWPGGVQDSTPKSVEEDLLSYSCPHCNELSANFNKFRLHMKCHISLKQYRCIQEGCLSFSDNVTDLIKHVKEEHPSPVYTCHICYEKFNTLEDIADHQQYHNAFGTEPKNPTKQYKCPRCDAIFKHPEKLSFHIFAENHNKVCIHCKKSFASEKRLRMHLQLHRELKPFKCQICGSSFHLKKYLKAHLLRHGNRNFQCSICKTMFRRADLLRRHMVLHEGKKIYKCTYKDGVGCKKEFSRKDKLNAHLKYHARTASAAGVHIKEESDETVTNTAILDESLDSISDTK